MLNGFVVLYFEPHVVSKGENAVFANITLDHRSGPGVTPLANAERDSSDLARLSEASRAAFQEWLSLDLDPARRTDPAKHLEYCRLRIAYQDKRLAYMYAKKFPRSCPPRHTDTVVPRKSI